MEYLEGQTLRDRLARGPLPLGETLALGSQIADALEDARASGIVHRDLKSANIIVTTRGDVKVLDFGLAKTIEDVNGSDVATASRLSDSGAVLGTVPYMSPEQALGQTVDHRSDLFSFGVVLYEMLTGRLPFAGATGVQVINAILHETPAPIPRFNDSVPDPVVRIVAKLLEKDRERRYQTARDVHNDLRRLQQESQATPVPGAPSLGLTPPPMATPASASGPSASSVGPRRGGLRWAAAAIVAVLGAGAAIAWYVRAHPSAPIDTPSLVVIPAEVTGPAQSAAAFEYLKDAVPATLSTRLSSVPGLETKVPPTTLEWDAVHHDVQHIVQAYSVHYYVAPHVVAEANRLSLTLQLVDGATREIKWSHDYAGAPDSYLTFIGQAADDLRDYLRAGGARTTSAGGARTSEAELAFQEGQRAWHRYNSLHIDADFDAALATLKRALALDPMLANAAAKIGWLYEFRWEADRVAELERTEIEHWAREALRIDSHCGLATSALAYLEISKPQIDLANVVRYGLKGANDAPRDALAQNLAGITVGNIGGAASFALAAQHEALDLDPLYRAAVNNQVATLFSLNRSPEGLVLLNDLFSREPETRKALWGEEFLLLSAVGRSDDARALLDRWSPTTPPQRRVVEDIIDLLERNDSAADQKIGALLSHAAQPETSGVGISQAESRLSSFLVKHGRIDAAIRLLEIGAGRSWLPRYDAFVSDERLAPLRRDPRAAPILASSKARLMQTIAILDQARADGQLPAYFVQPLAELHTKFGS